MAIKHECFQRYLVSETCSCLTRTIDLFQSSMPILILLDLPRGAPSWVGQNITQTLSMDIAFAVSNLSQQTAHSLTVFGDNLVALEDRVLDVEKQKGLNFTKFIPIYDF